MSRDYKQVIAEIINYDRSLRDLPTGDDYYNNASVYDLLSRKVYANNFTKNFKQMLKEPCKIEDYNELKKRFFEPAGNGLVYLHYIALAGKYSLIERAWQDGYIKKLHNKGTFLSYMMKSRNYKCVKKAFLEYIKQAGTSNITIAFEGIGVKSGITIPGLLNKIAIFFESISSIERLNIAADFPKYYLEILSNDYNYFQKEELERNGILMLLIYIDLHQQPDNLFWQFFNKTIGGGSHILNYIYRCLRNIDLDLDLFQKAKQQVKIFEYLLNISDIPAYAIKDIVLSDQDEGILERQNNKYPAGPLFFMTDKRKNLSNYHKLPNDLQYEILSFCYNQKSTLLRELASNMDSKSEAYKETRELFKNQKLV